jgi:uncharacterized protein
MHLTQSQARKFLLTYQSLLPPRRFKGKTGVMDYLGRVGCIQYDPLNIAGRNAELVLQARVADFTPRMLTELLYHDRRLVDGWDKLMSIYPVEDWPYFRRRREGYLNSKNPRIQAVHTILPDLRDALQERGPLSSIDLDHPERVDWAWAETRLARAALESMFWWGEVIIHHRVNTRRVYDLAHRWLPVELLEAPEPNPEDEDFQDWYVLRRIGSQGLTWNRASNIWLGMEEIKTPQRTAAVKRLLEQGRLLKTEVEGFKDPFYLRTQDKPLLDRSLESNDSPPQAAILAPLDNMLWDRRILLDLFGFDYVWEVYVPVKKRRYGYYVLPVLYGDRFIARCEPVYSKKSGILTLKNWWWEDGVKPDKSMRDAISECFSHFLAFLGADRLQIEPEALAKNGPDWLDIS